MTNHHHAHTQAAGSRHQQPPTVRQLNYLRGLAMRTGETFTYPRTSGEASREIDRLKGRAITPLEDRRRQDIAVGRDLQTSQHGIAAAVRDDELAGYGSTATWTSPGWHDRRGQHS